MPYRFRFPWHQGTSLPESSSGPWPHTASHSWGQNNWCAVFLPISTSVQSSAGQECLPACLSPPRLSHTRVKHQHGPSTASSLMPSSKLLWILSLPHALVSVTQDQGPHPLGSHSFPSSLRVSFGPCSLPWGHYSVYPATPHRGTFSLCLGCLIRTARTLSQDSQGGSKVANLASYHSTVTGLAWARQAQGQR